MTSPASILCPECRTSNEPGANFCARCGTSLRAAASLSGSQRAVGGASQSGRASVSQMGAAVTSPSASQPSPLFSSEDEIDIWLNRLIDGRYRVLARIGRGGMGLVYKVEHQRMGKIAAMKVLHRELASDKEVVKRFRREAEAVSKLTHPNTVQTFDFGTADGAMYLVMEYVRGEDLGTILRRDGPLPFLRAAPLLVQVCGALGEAHELGIVHRDLKPENILVTRTKDGTDHIKVLDFGLAKLSERPEEAEVTGRGAIVGTPYYMSPEQIRGEPLDHRSDIYSLGAMMYRMITGEHPFQAQTPVGVLTKHLTDEVVPPRVRRPDLEIDARVEAIILRAMSKRREARYATVDSMREDLSRAGEELMQAAIAAGARPSRTGLAVRRDTPSKGQPATTSGAVGPSTTPVRIAADGNRRAEEGSSAQPRLQREDLEAFERSLRRRSVLRLVVVPLILVGAAAGAFAYWHWSQSQPRAEEHEPNNEPQQATLIAAGRSVKGSIGRRLSDAEGDRDYYRVHVGGAPNPSGAPVKLSLAVTPIRNLDLEVVVLDESGRRLVSVDNQGVGGGEHLAGVAVTDDDVLVAVRESHQAAGAATGPTENITDTYELTVSVGPFAPDEEREPNDAEGEAGAILAGTPVHGTLARWQDVDRYRFGGPAGKYQLAVTGTLLPPLRVRVGHGEAKKELTQTVTLAPGDVISLERADPDASPVDRKPLAGADSVYTLTIKP